MKTFVDAGQPDSASRIARRVRRVLILGSLAIAAFVMTAAPAVADQSGVAGVTWNSGEHGSILMDSGQGVSALADFSNAPQLFGVTNRSSSKDPVDSILGHLNSDSSTITFAEWDAHIYGYAEYGDCTHSAQVFDCEFGVLPPGDGAVITLHFSNPSAVTSLTLQIDYPLNGCDRSGSLASTFVAPPASAADACTPPTHTRITTTKISQKKGTALFKFKANNTKSFKCVLLRNQRLLFNNKCGSPKAYANRLKPGHYEFIVDAFDQGGMDPHPAHKKFTIDG